MTKKINHLSSAFDEEALYYSHDKHRVLFAMNSNALRHFANSALWLQGAVAGAMSPFILGAVGVMFSGDGTTVPEVSTASSAMAQTAAEISLKVIWGGAALALSFSVFEGKKSSLIYDDMERVRRHEPIKWKCLHRNIERSPN